MKISGVGALVKGILAILFGISTFIFEVQGI